MPPAERTICLCAIDRVEQARIDQARRRLKHWDGQTWAVTSLLVPKACQDKIHVRPQTDQATDWLAFWVMTANDPHVVATDQFS